MEWSAETATGGGGGEEEERGSGEALTSFTQSNLTFNSDAGHNFLYEESFTSEPSVSSMKDYYLAVSIPNQINIPF